MLRRASQAFRIAAKNFRTSQTGNVALIFGLTIFPLLVAAGGFVDMTRAYYARTDMQDALDATALALSREAPGMSDTQMQAAAENYFYSNFNDTDVESLDLKPTYVASGPSLKVAGSASVKAYFLPLIHIDHIPVSASSTVAWGETRLRVALVLDNTGSMAQSGKMDALKLATHNLIKQLKGAAQTDGDVYVSIVPFSKDVNVGASNYNQSWVRWDLWDEVNGSCSKKQLTTKTSCEGEGKTWTAANHNTWNGCITDRDHNYDTLNTAPSTGTQATLFPAEQYGACPTQLMGLSYDWTALDNRVDAMVPNGFTNQAIGLDWGWQSLTNAPFTVPPTGGYYKYRQVIILLTDGLNTQNRWDNSAAPIDARQKLSCNAIKAADIEIYTVQVNTGGDPTSTLLQDCASGPANFFLLTSADQIVTTFDSIGTELSQLRVSM
jgi:Flp pilus assembly protein TadG